MNVENLKDSNILATTFSMNSRFLEINALNSKARLKRKFHDHRQWISETA